MADICVRVFGKPRSALNAEEIRRFRQLARMASYYRKHEYHKRQQVLRAREKKLEILSALRIPAKCQTCGYDRCIGALDFHHTEPHTKDANVLTLPMESAIIEARKCQLICANCHREIHYNSSHAGRPRKTNPQLEVYMVAAGIIESTTENS